jgi:hypothetical protein
LNYAMIRVMGLFVSIAEEEVPHGFFATVFVDLGPFDAMRDAARDELLARMTRHGVRLVEEGACRTLCVIVGMYKMPPESDPSQKPDGFTFFPQDTLWSRISGAADSAWRRWRRPEMVLV